MYYTAYHSPVGLLTLASDGQSLTGLWIQGQKYHGSVNGPMVEAKGLWVFELAEDWLDRYFSGERPDPCVLPLSPAGSDFRRAVWRMLCQIPYGQVTTYGQLARRIGDRMSPQAVGGAVSHNPISIIIPCHRVVGADGSLTGYAGGLDVKTRLLALEGVPISQLSSAVP